MVLALMMMLMITLYGRQRNRQSKEEEATYRLEKQNQQGDGHKEVRPKAHGFRHRYQRVRMQQKRDTSSQRLSNRVTDGTVANITRRQHGQRPPVNRDILRRAQREEEKENCSEFVNLNASICVGVDQVVNGITSEEEDEPN